MGSSWGGKGEPPKWDETEVYYMIIVFLGIFLILVGFKEGWL